MSKKENSYPQNEFRAKIKRDFNLRLIKNYQAANDIILACNTLVKLPPGKSGKKFFGQFEENLGSVEGQIVFENAKIYKKLSIKQKLSSNKFHISILSDKKLCVRSQYKGSTLKQTFCENIQLESADSALLALLEWASKVDPELDKKIKYAIENTRERAQLRGSLRPSIS
jgi:hypothetical protein